MALARFTKAGRERMLSVVFGPEPIAEIPFSLHLYQNNYDPNDDSVLSDFIECDFDGYSSIVLPRADWVEATGGTNVPNRVNPLGGHQFAAASGSQMAYGMYVLCDDDDTVLMAQLWDTPILIQFGTLAAVVLAGVQTGI